MNISFFSVKIRAKNGSFNIRYNVFLKEYSVNNINIVFSYM